MRMFCLTAAKTSSIKATDPVEDILTMDQKGEQQPECVIDQKKVQQSHDNVEEELDSKKMKEKAKGFLKHLKYISDCEGKPQLTIKNK